MKQLSMDELNRPAPEQYRAAEKMPVIVVLDNIRSGLNVGAIFRTCDAFAVEAIYLCGITVSPPHAEILKTALGSTDSVTWRYAENTIDILKELIASGYSILPVEQTDESVFLDDAKLTTDFPLALVFGNEMRGISAEILALCSKSLEVPQSGIKHSLNVATTAGIVLWECYRQFRLRRFLSPES
ncbi:MAG TPA: RNA methyltransferase [Flavitalea sp.]|nr:RNA methyltransferase [Flavitalea sp.]